MQIALSLRQHEFQVSQGYIYIVRSCLNNKCTKAEEESLLFLKCEKSWI